MESNLNLFRRHPFAVEAWFDRVIAVSFGFPEDVLRKMVPEGLEIDSFEGLGFVTVALVWTRHLRPAGFPKALGQDFFLSGYRIFTRLRDQSGRRLRGLKIIRSETDRRRMVWAGNLFTGYRYRHIALTTEREGERTTVETFLPDGTRTLRLVIIDSSIPPPLPPGSPFGDWVASRRFAGPMPFTFSPEGRGDFIVVEGDRQNWTPRPVEIREWQVALFGEAPLAGVEPVLANAFTVSGIPYRWKPGRLVQRGGNA